MWDDLPVEAVDWVVVPFVTVVESWWDSEAAMKALVADLPGFQDFPERFVLLDHSDLDQPYEGLGPAILLRASANHRDARARALPYNVPDPGPPSPIASAIIDVSFHGSTATHPLREALELWAHLWQPLVVDFRATPATFWKLDPDHQEELRQMHAEAIRSSRFVLCPRGRGLNTRRFFEVLAHGRIPVLYSDAARLPLEHLVDYRQFCVRVPEGFGRWTPDFPRRFLDAHDVETASTTARDVYERYFAPRSFRSLVNASVQE